MLLLVTCSNRIWHIIVQLDQSWTRWDKRAQRMLQGGKACYHFARARVVEFLSSVTSFCILTAYSSAELWVNIWSSCHSFKTCFNRRNGRKQTREEEVSCNSTVYFLRSYGAKMQFHKFSLLSYKDKAKKCKATFGRKRCQSKCSESWQ